jgi:hypothetical protein
MISLGALQAVSAAPAQDSEPSEAQVKAAFLVNFPKYVDWPQDALPATNSPISVAFFGGDTVAGEFRTMTEGKNGNGHPFVIVPPTVADAALRACQIIFIGASERQRLSEILGRLSGSSALTVGESDDFLGKGGIINLARKDRKIRLEVNLNAANDAHLKISSKLLSVADVLKGKPN